MTRFSKLIYLFLFIFIKFHASKLFYFNSICLMRIENPKKIGYYSFIEYWNKHVTIRPFYAKFLLSTWMFYSWVPGFATDCPCSFWWINHLPSICLSTFWKSRFKQQLVCKFDIAENIFCIVFDYAYTYVFTYLSLHLTIFNNDWCIICLIFTSQIVQLYLCPCTSFSNDIV